MKATASWSNEYVVCFRNDGWPVSLEPCNIYRVLPDAAAAVLGQLRVIDESGEDYLYPSGYFAPIELPQAVEWVFRKAS